jgi:hypothetical protein
MRITTAEAHIPDWCHDSFSSLGTPEDEQDIMISLGGKYSPTEKDLGVRRSARPLSIR